MKRDNLGDRMKGYEDAFRSVLNRKTYTILRLDGKAFHTYTKNLKKPFDQKLSEDFLQSTIALFNNVQGAKVAYTQSDEVSLLITDFENENTDLWFGGNVQKITSVAASIFTCEFNKRRGLGKWFGAKTPAFFDCRVFQLPTDIEVLNYFRWRNMDCIRNSISAIYYSCFSPKSGVGISTKERLEIIKSTTGHDLSHWPNHFVYGQIVDKQSYMAAWDFLKENQDDEEEYRIFDWIPAKTP